MDGNSPCIATDGRSCTCCNSMGLGYIRQCRTSFFPNPKPCIPNRNPSSLIINHWVLPPLSNSWIIIIIWLYTALNRTPNIDCYWVGAVPKLITWGTAVFNIFPGYHQIRSLKDDSRGSEGLGSLSWVERVHM